MKESLILKALDGPARLLEKPSPIHAWTELPNSISLTLTYNIGTVRLEGELPVRTYSYVCVNMFVCICMYVCVASVGGEESQLGGVSYDDDLVQVILLLIAIIQG